MDRADKFYLLELVLIIVATLVGTLILQLFSNPFLRFTAGALIALVFPGYLLLNYIYPGDHKGHPIWRICLVIPASVALVSIILLGMNYFWVYNLNAVVATLVVVNCFMGFGLVLRNSRGRNFSSTANWLMTIYDCLRTYHHIRKLRFSVIFLVVSILFVLSSCVYAVISPRHAYPVTEFYILAPTGRLTSPLLVDNVLKYGIINHEGRDVDYRVEVLTSSMGNMKEWWSETIFVKNGLAIERNVRLPNIPQADREIQILLFIKGDQKPYRSLAIPVRD